MSSTPDSRPCRSATRSERCRWTRSGVSHREANAVLAAEYLQCPGGVGNTEHDPVRFTSLINDVSAKLFDRLPDSVWFYPGHGKDSTLGAERPSLPEWR